jgi:hypothetical protein
MERRATTRTLHLAAAALAVLLAGCLDLDFHLWDPPPQPAQPTFLHRWTIDGQPPASACDAVGAAVVRLLGAEESTFPCFQATATAPRASAAELVALDGTVITGVLIPELNPGEVRPVAFSIPAAPTTATFTWALGSFDCRGGCEVAVRVMLGPTFARGTASAAAPSLGLHGLAPGDYQFLCMLTRAGFTLASDGVGATIDEAGASLACTFPPP